MNPSESDDDDDERPPTLVAVNHSSCPVTILSGFLGSGKTTLIQNLLQSPRHGKRIAVIENEFGEGLDIESLIARDGSDASLTEIVELPNGCVCCTIKSSLVQALEKLLEKRQDLDNILIECSGMANPGPIAGLFWLDEALESRLSLNGIVTLVDAKHIEAQLANTEEASQQIAYGDRILLNKTDLVTTSDVERIRTRIRTMNSTAEIRCTQYSHLPDALKWILQAKALEAIPVVDESHLSPDLATRSPEEHDQTHHHTDKVASLSFVESSGYMDLRRIDEWLALLLSEEAQAGDSPQQVFRVKGVIAANDDTNRKFIVQAVYDLWSVYPSTQQWGSTEERVSKIVVIGRNLDFLQLAHGFKCCLGCEG